MKKNLLILLVFALFAEVSWSQSYKVESTLGGVGNIGDKVTTDKYPFENSLCYFY